MPDTPQHIRPPQSTLQGVPFVKPQDIITDREEARRYLTGEHPPAARLLDECEKEEKLRQKRATIRVLLEQLVGAHADQRKNQKQHDPCIPSEEEWVVDMEAARPDAVQGMVLARMKLDSRGARSQNKRPAPNPHKAGGRETPAQKQEKGLKVDLKAYIRDFESRHETIPINNEQKLYCLNIVENLMGLSDAELAKELAELGKDKNFQALVVKVFVEELEAAEKKEKQVEQKRKEGETKKGREKEKIIEIQAQQRRDTITVGNRKTQAVIYTQTEKPERKF